MKRIAHTLAAFALLTAGSFTIGVETAGAATAAPLSHQATQRGPYASVQRNPHAAADAAATRGGPSASETKPGEQAPPPSIPYDADGPAYLPGQTKSTDFQLQH
jgi:hypothetical protein